MRLRFLPVLLILGLAAVAALPLASPAAPEAPDQGADRKAPAKKDDPSARDTFRQLSLFSDVFERVRADYVDPVTDEQLVENAINGMLIALDPHSSFLNKHDFGDMQTQTRGEFGGLGIEVTQADGLIKVVSPIDDTPAARAGMQPGDLITHIDQKPVTELSLNDAIDRMRGEPGTRITLTVRRGGLNTEPFDVSLTRAVIKIQSVRYRVERGNIGYIRITAFNEQTQVGLEKALAAFDRDPGDKLIGYLIDLRNNPGGLLEQAISVSSTFLPAGSEVVSTRGRHPEDGQKFMAKGGDRAHQKPMVVLVNGGSASASEIVAGALQDHQRAIVLGTKSFGKGSVQTVIPVAGGSAIRLTTARYYTPSGRSIQALGIVPDIEVQPAKVEAIDYRMVSEADLKGALKNENGAPAPSDPEDAATAAPKDSKEDGMKDSAPADNKGRDGKDKDGKDKEGQDKEGRDRDGKNRPPVDYQLERGLDLLRGVSFFERSAPAAIKSQVKGSDGKNTSEKNAEEKTGDKTGDKPAPAVKP